MLRAKSRLIQHYDLKLHPYPRALATIDRKFNLTELYNLLKHRIDNQLANYIIRKGTVSYRLLASQLNITGGYIVLLIQHGDKNTATPGFVSIPTGATRYVPRGEDEGNGACAHLIVSIAETASDTQTFKAVLETIPGISRTVVESLFNSELKHASDGHLFYSTENGGQKNLRPIVELVGHPSDTLLSAIRGGAAQEILLISPHKVSKLDESIYITETERIMRFSLDPAARGERAINLVNGLFGIAKKGMTREMRVRFRTGGRTQTVDINLAAESIEDTSFIKVTQIDLDVPLDALTEVIRYDLVLKMVELLG